LSKNCGAPKPRPAEPREEVGIEMRIAYIASNTFREAVRDRVLYNLIAFALLLSGAAILVGQISIEIEKLVVINLGLTAVSLFGVVIAIFIGIGLVSKEIEKRTLYTVLSRPVRRWEFIVGKFFGLAGTLVVNTFFMAVGVFAALFYVSHKFVRADALILVALYFIVLQFLIVCALALLFSSFSSPLLSAVFAFSLFVIGSFAEDLRNFAALAHGLSRWLATGAAYLVPNFSAFNVITSIAHEQPVAGQLILQNTLYAAFYAIMALCGAVLIFEYRDLK
jgi:ABC-type transport system involved in multi-copper enzyme maturation permease subunit